MRKNILLAMDNSEQSRKIKSILTSQGFNVASIVKDAYAALRSLRTQNVDLSIIDNDLTGMNGLQLAKIIADENLGSVILLIQGNFFVASDVSSIYGVLTKPVHEYQLVNTLKLALSHYESKKNLEDEVNSLKDTLEARKVIEKAKGLLMKKGFTEDLAYKKLRQISMEKRVPLKKVAQTIVSKFS